MAYIIGFVVVVLFFVALHYLTELNKSQKIITSTIVFLIISAAIAYNTYTDKQRETMLNVVLKYNQNKTVNCNGTDVNNTNYTLSIGTYTFIGMKDTPVYSQMISVSECE